MAGFRREGHNCVDHYDGHNDTLAIIGRSCE